MRSMFFSKLKTTLAGAALAAALGLASLLLVRHEAAALAPVKEAASEKGGDQKKDDKPSAAQRFFAHVKKSPVRRFPGVDDLGLFVMDLASKEVALVAAEVDQERAYCGSPSWSKDGSRIVFDASPGQKWDRTRLQMLELTDEGLGLRGLGAGNCPTLSPDGTYITYLVNRGAVAGLQEGIYVMKADGGERRRLGGYGIPRWSPDGKQVLVASFSNPCELSLVEPDKAHHRPVKAAGHTFYSVPSWAAENTLVAVVRSNKNVVSVSLVDVTDPGDAKVKDMLCRRDDNVSVEPIYPVYSPELKRGVFVGREKKGQALYTFEPGKAPERLEGDRYDTKIASLALSPCGRYVLFCSDRR